MMPKTTLGSNPNFPCSAMHYTIQSHKHKVKVVPVLN